MKPHHRWTKTFPSFHCNWLPKPESKQFFATFFLCLILLSFSVQADSTLVSITPEESTLSTDSQGSIRLQCNPTEPVKAFECGISFDPTYIQIINVTEGDFFTGYSTFFNNGSIDNTNGTIEHIYGLVMGPGNSSAPGDLITIHFLSSAQTGQSLINITGLGVTNESQYLPVSSQNGSLMVHQHIILSNPQPVHQSTVSTLQQNRLNITINHTTGGLFDYHITTSPAVGNSSATGVTNDSFTVLLSSLSFDTSYTWMVAVQDQSTGLWTNQSYQFSTQADPNQDDDDDGGGGGGGFLPPPVEEENTAPSRPMITGPTMIETNTSYQFTVISSDEDNDSIRYLLHWDDGNSSTWTAYAASNQSIIFNHSWNDPGNVSIMVLAQDSNGDNSSWSTPHQIQISENRSSEPYQNPVTLDFDSVQFANTTVSFSLDISNLSSSNISSIHWDFNGHHLENITSPRFSFETAGIYPVTVTIIDSLGNQYQHTREITVTSTAASVQQSLPVEPSRFMVQLFIGGISVLAVLFVFKFREHILYLFIRTDQQLIQQQSQQSSPNLMDDSASTLSSYAAPVQQGRPMSMPVSYAETSPQVTEDEHDTADQPLYGDSDLGFQEPLAAEPDLASSMNTADSIESSIDSLIDDPEKQRDIKPDDFGSVNNKEDTHPSITQDLLNELKNRTQPAQENRSVESTVQEEKPQSVEHEIDRLFNKDSSPDEHHHFEPAMQTSNIGTHSDDDIIAELRAAEQDKKMNIASDIGEQQDSEENMHFNEDTIDALLHHNDTVEKNSTAQKQDLTLASHETKDPTVDEDIIAELHKQDHHLPEIDDDEDILPVQPETPDPIAAEHHSDSIIEEQNTSSSDPFRYETDLDDPIATEPIMESTQNNNTDIDSIESHIDHLEHKKKIGQVEPNDE